MRGDFYDVSFLRIEEECMCVAVVTPGNARGSNYAADLITRREQK
jgi:hypothetical protein